MRTARLELRRWREEDRDAFVAIWTDPDVGGALRPGDTRDPAAVANARFDGQLRHWHEHGFGLWAASEGVSVHLGPPRVISIIDPGNEPSAAVARRLGMRDSRGAVHPELGLEVRVYERALLRPAAK